MKYESRFFYSIMVTLSYPRFPLLLWNWTNLMAAQNNLFEIQNTYRSGYG